MKQKLDETQGWISIADRTPERSGMVQVKYKDGSAGEATWILLWGCFISAGNKDRKVIGWKPLNT